MTRWSKRWLAVALVIGCAPDIEIVGESLDGDAGAEGSGERSDDVGETSGAGDDGDDGDFPAPAPAGDGCAAPECTPQLLWIHELAPPRMVRSRADTLGRPMWVHAAGGDTQMAVSAYDPATDIEEVVAGPFPGYDDGLSMAVDGVEGLRVLIPFGVEPAQLLRLDGSDIVWSYEFDSIWLHPTDLVRGPDGTSYALAFMDDEAQVWAISNDGALLWQWLLHTRDDGLTAEGWFASSVAAHEQGISFFRERSNGDESGDHQSLVTRVEDNQLIGEVDLAPALANARVSWNAVTPLDGGWLATPEREGENGSLLAKFDAGGALEWYRHDPATRGSIRSYTVTDTRILVVAFDGEPTHGIDVRSYERDGELRGAMTLDLSAYSDEAFPYAWHGAGYQLPDGTVVVQANGTWDGTWLIGIRP